MPFGSDFEAMFSLDQRDPGREHRQREARRWRTDAKTAIGKGAN